jgi:predicted PurR-regulated permease PerM
MAQQPLAGGLLSPPVGAPSPANQVTNDQGGSGQALNGQAGNGQASSGPFANWTLRQIILATMTVVAVGLAFMLLYRFYNVVFLLFVAIALQIALDPLVRFLAGRGVHKVAAVFAIYVVLFAVAGSVLWFAGAPLVDQVRDVGGRLPGYYQQLRQSLVAAPIGLVRGLASVLPEEPSPALLVAVVNQSAGEEAGDAAAEATETAGTAAEASTGASPGQAWQWFVTGSKAFFGLFAVFAIAFYWTLEGDVILRRLILKAPARRRDELRALVTESQSKIGAYFRGQVILCSIVGIAATIAYLLLGIPNAFLLGLLMAIFEVVPLVGPFLGAIPGIIVTMSEAPEMLIFVVGALILIQTLEANLLVPRVMDHSVGVNAIISMLALAAFGALFGLLGALLAVPLAAILQIVIGRVLFQTPIGDETVSAAPVATDVSRSRLGVLRLEAQNLVLAVRKQARNGEENGDADESNAEQTEDDIEAIAAEIDVMLSSAEAVEAQEVQQTDSAGETQPAAAGLPTGRNA